MPTRTVEIRHFAALIASLTVTAARAGDPESLAGIQRELEEALVDVFSLLSHDALPDRPTLLDAELLARIVAEQLPDGAEAS